MQLDKKREKSFQVNAFEPALGFQLVDVGQLLLDGADHLRRFLRRFHSLTIHTHTYIHIVSSVSISFYVCMYVYMYVCNNHVPRR